jgi:hypothetical protein
MAIPAMLSTACENAKTSILGWLEPQPTLR